MQGVLFGESNNKRRAITNITNSESGETGYRSDIKNISYG
jgi:hypothetical protein